MSETTQSELREYVSDVLGSPHPDDVMAQASIEQIVGLVQFERRKAVEDYKRSLEHAEG